MPTTRDYTEKDCLWRRMLPMVVTTFYLPDAEGDLGMLTDLDESEHAKELQPPFPCIRILQNVTESEDVNGLTIPTHTYNIDTIVLNEGGGSWIWGMRFKLKNLHNGNAIIDTYPEAINHEPMLKHEMADVREYLRAKIPHSCKRQLPMEYVALMEKLNAPGNSVGFIENPTSRQVRRALGVGPEYREYIIVNNRREAAGRPYLTRGELFRRHPYLHAVRGHLRHYKSGRVAYVHPHLRGTGDAVQIKDYIVR
jgi:hypothetical protein